MVNISGREWQIASIAACVSIAAGAAIWYLNSQRPTEEEIEHERREVLVNFGRIVDGMILDGYQVTASDGTVRDMLLYGYEISGVRYECSQDITALREIFDPSNIKIGMLCSIRYQPGSPENSIVVAERWSGLRTNIPIVYPHLEEASGSLESIHPRDLVNGRA
jgi:hypothetical protein